MTGKNGSGKTSVLEAISTSLWARQFDALNIDFSSDQHDSIDSIVYNHVYFSTNRKSEYREYEQQSKFHAETQWSKELIYQHFIQYLTELKIKASLEATENDGSVEDAKKISDWFEFFTKQLRTLFQSPDLQLKFVWKPTFQLLIREQGKSFTFNQMPDGYSSLLAIVAELILRSQHKKIDSEIGLQGIVMIDEIENHLHIDLQKKILPFLTSFFPNIQFIVTTHSPFVINSISNAVVCDLEKMQVIQEDLSSYSYETIVEGFFGSDQYSDVLKKNLEEFEFLEQKSNKTDEEIDKYLLLRRYLKDTTKLFSEELAVKIHQLEQQQLKKTA